MAVVRRGRLLLAMVILLAAGFLFDSGAARADVVQDTVVTIQKLVSDPGSIDIGRTCNTVEDAIQRLLEDNPGDPIALGLVDNMELGPATIVDADLLLDCGGQQRIGVMGTMQVFDRPVAIQLDLLWDDGLDELPALEFRFETGSDETDAVSTTDLINLTTDFFPGAFPDLEADPGGFGAFTLTETNLFLRVSDDDTIFDLLAATVFDPKTGAEGIAARFLVSITDTAATDAQMIYGLRLESAVEDDDTIDIGAVLGGGAGDLAAAIELPEMVMAMTVPDGYQPRFTELRSAARDFMSGSGQLQIPTEFRFDGTLSLLAQAELDPLGPNVRNTFGYAEGATALLTGNLGFDFGTLNADEDGSFDVSSVDLRLELPALSGAGQQSVLPEWMTIDAAALTATYSEEAGSVELGALATSTVDVPDETQPGGSVALTFDLAATLRAGPDAESGENAITIALSGLSPEPAPGDPVLWPAPYGQDWLNLERLGAEVTAVFPQTADPRIDAAVTSSFEIDGKDFDVRLSLDATPSQLLVTLKLRLLDTISLAEVLGLFGDFDLPPEFDGLTIGVPSGEGDDSTKPVELTASLAIGDETSVGVALEAPGSIEIAGSPFEVNFLFSLAYDGAGVPSLLAGARTSGPVLVSDLLGGALGPDFAAAFQEAPLDAFNFQLPPVGLVITSERIDTPSTELAPDRHEFFRTLYGCGGEPAPENCTFQVRLNPGLHLMSAISLPTDEDGRPMFADLMQALWLTDGQTPVPVLFKASVEFEPGSDEVPTLMFEGVSLDLVLPINPGPDVRPDWFHRGDLAIRLGVGPSGAKFELVGTLAIRMRDNTPPADQTMNPDCTRSWLRVVALPTEPTFACYDVLTFSVLTEVVLGPTPEIVLAGALRTEPGIGWQEPLGIEFLRVDSATLQLGIKFVAGMPQFEIGLQAGGALFEKDFSGSVLFGLKPLPNPPFVVPTFGGLRLTSAAGLELADVAKLYEAMRQYAADFVAAAEAAADATGGVVDIPPAVLQLLDLPEVDPADLGALPNVSLRNLDLMVSIADAPRLCLQPGLIISAELLIDAPPLDGAPPTFQCGDSTPPPLVQPAECLARLPSDNPPRCFAAVLVQATLDGLIVSGAVGTIDIGPMHWDDGLFDLQLTPTNVSMTISGETSVDGLWTGDVRVHVGTDGLAFLGDVVLFPDLGDPDDPDAPPLFRAGVEGQVAVDVSQIDWAEPNALAALDFDLHAVLRADFAAAFTAFASPLLDGLRDAALVTDGVLDSFVGSGGDPTQTVLDLPDTLRAAGQPVPLWLENPDGPDLIEAIEALEALLEPYGVGLPTFDQILGGVPLDPAIPGIEGAWIPADRECRWVDPILGTVTGIPGTVVGETCYSEEPGFFGSPGRLGAWVEPVCYVDPLGLVLGTPDGETCWAFPPIDEIPGVCDALPAVPCTTQAFVDDLIGPAFAPLFEALGLEADANLSDVVDLLVATFSQATVPVNVECVDFRVDRILDAAAGDTEAGLSLRFDVTLFGADFRTDTAWSFRQSPWVSGYRFFGKIIADLIEPPDVECEAIGTTTVAGTGEDGEGGEGGEGGPGGPVAPGVDLELDQTAVEAGNTVTLKAKTNGLAADTPVFVTWGDEAPSPLAAAALGPELPPSYTVSDLEAGITHEYADDHPETGTPFDVLTIEVTAGEFTASIPVTIANIAPTELTLSTATIDEGNTATLTGSFTDADADTHSVDIDWGDGSTSTIELTNGERSFSADHIYVDDDPTATPSDRYDVDVVVTDDDTGTVHDDTTITVHNLAPADVVLTPVGDVLEGQDTEFTVSFTDAGVADTHTVVVDWGDGTRSTHLGDPTGTTVHHRFVDDDPTATLQDTYDLIVSVVDDDGGVVTATDVEVTVLDVAPTVTVTLDHTNIDEGDTVEATVEWTDPGVHDWFDIVVDWGDPLLPDTVLTALPGETSVTASQTYGDDGTFTVTATVTDDDTGQGSSSTSVVVANLDPVGSIDRTATVDTPSGPTFVLRQDEDLTLSATATDVGSDDLVFDWDWDDGLFSQGAYLLDPPSPDPDPSPDVSPRDETDEQTHEWADACLYDVVVTFSDDDAGSSSDQVAVVVTGTDHRRRVSGWWTNQFEPGSRNRNDLSDAQLDCYVRIAEHFSAVFSEERALADHAAVMDVLEVDQTSDERELFDRQLLAAWLNVAHGSLGLDDGVDTDGDGLDDTTVGALLWSAEARRLDPLATRDELLDLKDVLEDLNRGKI